MDEGEEGGTWTSLVSSYAFQEKDEIETKFFLYGIQSLHTPREVLETMSEILLSIEQISAFQLPEKYDLARRFIDLWLKSELKRDGIEEELSIFIRNLGEGEEEGKWEAQNKTLLHSLRGIEERKSFSFSLENSLPLLDISIFYKTKIQGLADSLTHLAWNFFRNLKLSDFFTPKSPNLSLSAQLFDKISFWVASSILSSPSPQKPLSVFTKVAYLLFKKNDFETLFSVLTGIQNVAITRLSNVWSGLSTKTLQKYKHLSQLVDPAGGYKHYRSKLRSLPENQPCLPYLALILRDFAHIRDGAATYLDEDGGQKKEGKLQPSLFLVRYSTPTRSSLSCTSTSSTFLASSSTSFFPKFPSQGSLTKKHASVPSSPSSSVRRSTSPPFPSPTRSSSPSLLPSSSPSTFSCSTSSPPPSPPPLVLSNPHPQPSIPLLPLLTPLSPAPPSPSTPPLSRSTPKNQFFWGENEIVINKRKILLFGKCLNELFERSKIPFLLEPDMNMVEYIQKASVLDDDQLYEKSLQIHPLNHGAS